MNEKRFAVYTDSLEPDSPALFAEIEEYAAENSVPIIRRMSASFLETAVRMKKPRRILEIGTAIGYSGLRMLCAAPEALLDTVELDPERSRIAAGNFRKAGVSERVKLLQGDAAMILPELPEKTYDFIFLDGPKGQYLQYLPFLKKLLKAEGVLLADNMLQEGRLLEPRSAVIRRDRTIHERLRAFISEVYRDPAFHATLLPVEDGLLIGCKLSDKEDKQ